MNVSVKGEYALQAIFDLALNGGKEPVRIADIARSDPDVRGVHDLRTRSAGLTKFIQLHIELDPALPLLRAHEIGDRVEAELQRRGWIVVEP